jgi:hypothetical protein
MHSEGRFGHACGGAVGLFSIVWLGAERGYIMVVLMDVP